MHFKMKKLDRNLRTIIEMIFLILLYFSFTTFKNQLFSFSILIIWGLIYLKNLNSNLLYKKGKVDYVLIPHRNDNFFKITFLVLGGFLFLLSIISIVFLDLISYFPFMLLIISFLIFMNGIFYLPKEKLIVSDNYLIISGLSDRFQIRSLKEINVYSSKILIVNNLNEKFKIDNLEIDSFSYGLIYSYLKDKGVDFKCIKFLNS